MKYGLTSNTKKIGNTTLYQIKALKSFGDINRIRGWSRQGGREMRDDLLPCPFCGREAELLHYPTDGYLPKCKLCDGMIEKWFLIKEEAIVAWNHRTPAKEGE